MSFHPPWWHSAYVIWVAINKPNKTLAPVLSRVIRAKGLSSFCRLQLFGNANYQEHFAQAQSVLAIIGQHVLATKHNIRATKHPIAGSLFYSPAALSYFSSLYLICSQWAGEPANNRRHLAISANVTFVCPYNLLYVCARVCVCVWNVKWPPKLAITHTTRWASVLRSFTVRQFISGGLAHSSLAPSNRNLAY